MESLLSVDVVGDPVFRQVSQYLTKVSMNPQGQLCVQLNRPMAFTECLVRVGGMGSRYGHLIPALSAAESPESILLVNDVSVLKRMASEGGGTAQSGCGLGESGCGFDRSGPGGCGLGGGDMSMSDARGMLLVGVVSNILRARGYAVHHHHGNWPQQTVSVVCMQSTPSNLDP